jgi:hypothetical protein
MSSKQVGENEDFEIPKIEPGIYRHYKGKDYEVISVGLDTESHEPMVIYKPLYKSNVPFWVRPYSMFISKIEIDGKQISRFTKH